MFWFNREKPIKMVSLDRPTYAELDKALRDLKTEKEISLYFKLIGIIFFVTANVLAYLLHEEKVAWQKAAIEHHAGMFVNDSTNKPVFKWNNDK